jgi:four helix bundle protein
MLGGFGVPAVIIMLDNTDRWKNLEVWQLADEFALLVYQKTRNFPKEEIYGLTSQLRRAALSVPTNIVEGYSRKGDRELWRFLDIALGSFAEVKYLLHFAHQLQYLSVVDYQTVSDTAQRLGAKLWKFYERLRGEET